MTTVPSRQDIDRAETLDFPDRKPAEKDVSICIEAGPAGVTVRVDYVGPLGSIPAAIERLKRAGVLELVTAARGADVHTPARKGAAMITTPAYDGSGQAMCPVHRKPLSEGRYGLFCPSKAEGEHANAKGWCNIRFAE